MKYEKPLVIFLLLIFALQAIAAYSKSGLTVDELAHIPAGYSYIKEHDFRMNPEHPSLMKSLSGLFLLPLNPELPTDHPSWNDGLTDGAAEWVFGAQFMFFRANDADQILFWARLPIVLTALLLGFYLWRWAREWYGDKAALLALFLFTFCPNLLAHSGVVTTDVGVTTFAFITIYYWMRTLKSPTWQNAIKTGVAFGLALAAKFTGIYLVGILPLVALSQTTKEQQQQLKSYALRLLNPFLIVMGGGAIILLLAYQVIGIPVFFVGFWKVILHARLGHNAFLLGAYSTTGWWYYFIVTFFLKTPIAFIIVMVARLFYTEVKPFGKQALALLIPAIIFFVSFMLNTINIGHRHVLLIYPFFYLWVAPLANIKLNWQKIGLTVLLVAYAVSSLMIYPHYLSYFNEFVGPSDGYKYLLDSNIDWGQDLPALKEWMSTNNITNMTMAYFGLDSREYRKIVWGELKCRPTEGLIAISVNRLQGLNPKDAKCTEWLRSQTPIAEAGYSIKIFNITQEQFIPITENFCREECSVGCKQKKLALASSVWINETCKCGCF